MLDTEISFGISVKSKMVKLKLFWRRFTEAWTSCLLCMVQGDLTVLSVNHAITASKTGFTAALAYVALSYSAKFSGSKIAAVWLISVCTMLADFFIHPTHFGPEMAEAVLTGLGAGLLAYISITIFNK